MDNYRRDIQGHLLPEFGDSPLKSITARQVSAWEKRARDAGYAHESITTYRSRLHLVLADAMDEGLIDANPATRRRNRGRRAGRIGNRGPEKVTTSPLGILLIAERMAVLSGRDDEFVANVTIGYTGMRYGELVGLEPQYVRDDEIRVEQQLVELDSGELELVPPKDDSYRTLDANAWLVDLLRAFIAQKQPKPCPCHGRAFLFDSFGTVRRWGRGGGPTLKDVAKAAGVSTGTVSNVLNHPEVVREETRLRVTEVIAELDYMRGRTSKRQRPTGAARPSDPPLLSGRARQVPPRGRKGGQARAARTDPGRPVHAGHFGSGPQGRGPGNGLLGADRPGPHAARRASLPQDAHGGAGHTQGPHGRADGSHRRLGLGALLARLGRDAEPPSWGGAGHQLERGVGRSLGHEPTVSRWPTGHAAASSRG
ncbi:LacI family DNA-binding transcriptional regulator [Streptomyces luteolus]|uniref:LacI family DNA-binding transcriptional regulator n=1 Tax=Streptomyces luteolus TaxID=3043615 RepID=A0ABT6SZG8_9ACTN|nr:LacI family DNA-binding transcriptional regulator [Streptomyces sp. B-S-A12]MDI3420580.1 LacI family DNA-binding transcriptional regulator [Streptomyces sp. B-S-A12]